MGEIFHSGPGVQGIGYKIKGHMYQIDRCILSCGLARQQALQPGLCMYGLLQLPADCSQGQQQKWDTELRKGNKSKGENRLSCMKAVVINKHTSGTTAITTLKTQGMTGVSPCRTHAAIAQGVLSC